jgi:hypothetical protein
LGTGILAVIMIVVATATTLAVPVVVVLWLTHTWPFERPTAAVSTISFCSSLNELNNYSLSHATPSTAPELERSIKFSDKALSNVHQIPADISGTVNATLATTSKLLNLLQLGTENGFWTASQKQQAVNFDTLFRQEAKTLNVWYQSNC